MYRKGPKLSYLVPIYGKKISFSTVFRNVSNINSSYHLKCLSSKQNICLGKRKFNVEIKTTERFNVGSLLILLVRGIFLLNFLGLKPLFDENPRASFAQSSAIYHHDRSA